MGFDLDGSGTSPWDYPSLEVGGRGLLASIVLSFTSLYIYPFNLFSDHNFCILTIKGSGVVTRRPLILQLVHTPPKNKTTASKKSAKEEKPKVGEDDDEDGEACKCGY